MALTEGACATEGVDYSAFDGGPGILHFGTAAPCGTFLAHPKNRPKRHKKSRQEFSGPDRNYPASVTLFTHACMTNSKNPAGWGIGTGGSHAGAKY
jgi:hypothetical protein